MQPSADDLQDGGTPTNDDASALIVVIAVLFVMFLIASILALLSTSQRTIARSYSDQVQARMVAQSGIEHALSNMDRILTEEARYYGEDWDENGELSGVQGNTLNGGTAGGSEDANGNRNGQLDRRSVEPKYALNPSFARTRSVGGEQRPLLVEIKRGEEFVYRGISGTVPSSYGGGGDVYTLRVLPRMGINVNSLNPHVGEMINNLCGQLPGCNEDSQPGFSVVGPFPDVEINREDRDDDGRDERVLQTGDGERPDVVYDPDEVEIRGGYGSIQELEGDLGGNFDALEKWLVVEENVFVDTSVIRPKPQNTDRTFDENGDCPEDAGPYDSCRNEGGGDLQDAYPLPDNVAGEPKAIRGRIDDGEDSSLDTHTEQIRWVNNAGGTSVGDLPQDLSEDSTNEPYGAFRYNFNYSKQPRAPVSINSAEQELMAALMEGLRARVLEVTEREVNEPGGTTGLPYIEHRFFNPMYQTRVIPNPDGPNAAEEGGLSEGTVEEIVEAIASYRTGDTQIQFRGSSGYTGPFRTWAEFEAFVDQRIVQELGYSNDIGFLLKAHFNPNTRFGKFNGNTNAHWTWISDGKDCSSPPCDWQGNRVTIDKTDFLYHTTEFTLQPPTHYQIASHGRVLGQDNSMQAQASVRALVQSHRVARHTTQADFEINQKEEVTETFNVTSYPENVANINDVGDEGEAQREIIENRENTGSGLGGQLALRTKTDYNPIGEADTYIEWSYDRPDESTRGRWDPEEDAPEFTVNQENNPHHPMSWFSREYNDVSDDGTEENYGLVGGKWNPEETGDYPWNEEESDGGTMDPSEDPYNYADLAPDGMIMTSDRYRFQQHLTTHSNTPAENAPDVIPFFRQGNENWSEGHVEFWWKPRAGTAGVRPEAGDDTPEGEKVIYPMWNTWIANRGTPQAGEDEWFYGFIGPHVTKEGEDNRAFHRATWQENYAWRIGGTGVDPVQAGVGTGIKRWDDGNGTDPLINEDGSPQTTGQPSGTAKVGRPPVNEAQRWAGYECGDDMSWDNHSDRWQNGAGTIARINPATGCLTAYPGIQYVNFSHPQIGGKPNFHGRADGGAFDEIEEDNPRIVQPEDEAHPNMDWNHYTDYYLNTSDRMVSKQIMGGHYIRSYYVKEPADSSRSSKWVVKWSQEHFMDMDTGIGTERSPDATTAGRGYWTDMDNHDAMGTGGGAGTYENMNANGPAALMTSEVVSTINIGELSGTKRKKATPKPGKWNHITIEFDRESMYAFRDGDVGPGVSYPLYAPWDFWHSFTDGGRNVTEGEIADDGDPGVEQWLPIAAIPRVPDENVQMWITEPGGFDTRDGDVDEHTEFIVPQITVNGVEKTHTDLYAGNVNPITGRFQPAPTMYAEHVVWMSEAPDPNPNQGEGGDGEQDQVDIDEMDDYERATAWYYMQHYTHKHYGNLAQFGSNFTRKTKHYGQFGNPASELDQKAWGNWARFYDDGFIEGTVDELIWTNDNNVEEPQEGGPPYEEGRYKTAASLQGRFHRGTEHDHGEESYWEENDEDVREKFNFYAEQDMKVLGGERDQDEELRVLSVAHTQYRPTDEFYQRDYHEDGTLADASDERIAPSERPYWRVRVKGEADSWTSISYSAREVAPNGFWLGEPLKPEELMGEELTVEPDEDLEYRLDIVDPNNRSTLNITPFFEDITVLYRKEGAAKLKGLIYYTPD